MMKTWNFGYRATYKQYVESLFTMPGQCHVLNFILAVPVPVTYGGLAFLGQVGIMYLRRKRSALPKRSF